MAALSLGFMVGAQRKPSFVTLCARTESDNIQFPYSRWPGALLRCVSPFQRISGCLSWPGNEREQQSRSNQWPCLWGPCVWAGERGRGGGGLLSDGLVRSSGFTFWDVMAAVEFWTSAILKTKVKVLVTVRIHLRNIICLCYLWTTAPNQWQNRDVSVMFCRFGDLEAALRQTAIVFELCIMLRLSPGVSNSFVSQATW